MAPLRNGSRDLLRCVWPCSLSGADMRGGGCETETGDGWQTLFSPISLFVDQHQEHPRNHVCPPGPPGNRIVSGRRATRYLEPVHKGSGAMRSRRGSRYLYGQALPTCTIVSPAPARPPFCRERGRTTVQYPAPCPARNSWSAGAMMIGSCVRDAVACGSCRGRCAWMARTDVSPAPDGTVGHTGGLLIHPVFG